MDGHVHAFAFYGGVFPVLIYDNLTVAVRKVFQARDRIEQDGFVRFSRHVKAHAEVFFAIYRRLAYCWEQSQAEHVGGQGGNNPAGQARPQIGKGEQNGSIVRERGL